MQPTNCESHVSRCFNLVQPSFYSWLACQSDGFSFLKSVFRLRFQLNMCFCFSLVQVRQRTQPSVDYTHLANTIAFLYASGANSNGLNATIPLKDYAYYIKCSTNREISHYTITSNTTLGAHVDTTGGAHVDKTPGAHVDTTLGVYNVDTTLGAHVNTTLGVHVDTTLGAHVDTILNVFKLKTYPIHLETVFPVYRQSGDLYLQAQYHVIL